MNLECECGYVASGDTDDSLVRIAQVHAWDMHQTRLAGPTILSVAGRRSRADLAPERATRPLSVPSGARAPRDEP